MRHNQAIRVDSDEYNAMFTSDGKLDFTKRIGMDHHADPLLQADYKMDSRGDKVNFGERNRYRDIDETRYKSVDLDDDNNVSEDW